MISPERANVASNPKAKPGACVSLLYQSEALSLEKTLKEQGLRDAMLSYVYLPVNLRGAWHSLKAAADLAEKDTLLDGVTQLKGADDLGPRGQHETAQMMLKSQPFTEPNYFMSHF